VSWLDTAHDRRLFFFLVIIGIVASGWVLSGVRTAWRNAREERERRRPKPDTPVYAGVAPPTGPYVFALGVGAIRAAEHEEPVDRLDYTRSAKRARMLLGEILGDEPRERVPRALRALLGGVAEVPASGSALAEEALRRRTAVGPELWTHALDELATARGLP
jgi:hypothetical protein